MDDDGTDPVTGLSKELTAALNAVDSYHTQEDLWRLVAPMLENRGECPIEMILQGEKELKKAKELADGLGEEPEKKVAARNGGWRNKRLWRMLRKIFT